MISFRSSSDITYLECGICLLHINKSETTKTIFSYPTIIPCCKKEIHLLCLKAWFQKKQSCPFCRKENMFSREGKLLSMQKLYNDKKLPFSSEEKLVEEFDEFFPLPHVTIFINPTFQESSSREGYINFQIVTLISVVAVGIIFLSTLLLPLYQS